MNCVRCGNILIVDFSSCLRCGAAIKLNAKTTPDAQAKTHRESRDTPPGPESSEASQVGKDLSVVTDEGSTNFDWYSGMFITAVVVIVFMIITINFFANIGTESPDQSTAKHSTVINQSSRPNTYETQNEEIETKPPIDRGLLLSSTQVRYCLSEAFRLEGMEAYIDKSIATEVGGFNTNVDDYNDRCGDFQFRDGALSAATRSFAGLENQYRLEGQKRVLVWRQKRSFDSSASRILNHIPTQVVRNSQKVLTDLGYYQGDVNGQINDMTVAAVKTFQKDYGFQIDGVIDERLYANLYDLRPREISNQVSTIHVAENDLFKTHKELVQNYVVLKSDERAIENACARMKQRYGIDAYNYCIADKTFDLKMNPSNFSLSGLSESVKLDISVKCDSKKLLLGPAEYNKCAKEIISHTN